MASADTPGAQLRPRDELLAMLDKQIADESAEWRPGFWLKLLREAAERIRADTPTEPGSDGREAVKHLDRALLQETRLGSNLAGVNWQAVVGMMRGDITRAKEVLARRAQGSFGGEGAPREAWLWPAVSSLVLEAAQSGSFSTEIFERIRTALSAPPVSRGEARLRAALETLADPFMTGWASECEQRHHVIDKAASIAKAALATPGGGDAK